MTDPELPEQAQPISPERDGMDKRPVYLCDRCGFEIIEEHCKVVCLNCGARWDCSDLSIYTD